MFSEELLKVMDRGFALNRETTLVVSSGSEPTLHVSTNFNVFLLDPIAVIDIDSNSSFGLGPI